MAKEDNRMLKYTLLLFIILIILSVLSLFLGSWNIGFAEILNALTNSEEVEINKYIAVINVRIPRTLLAIVAGAILSVCGIITQACFRNPLADPYFLGISSGSAFGAAFAIVFNFNISFFAPFFSIMATIIPLIVTMKYVSSTLILLFCGIIVNSFFSSGLSILKIISEIGALREITFWLMGSLSNSNLYDILLLYILFIIIFIIILYFAPRIDLISVGDFYALEHGINPYCTRCIFLFLSAFLMAFLIRLTGIIGWVGLCVPHIVRMIFKINKTKHLIILSALTGSILLLISDTLIRILSKLPLYKEKILGELPISVTSSIVCATCFIIVIIINRKNRHQE